jgi:hypothetical protein
MLGTALYAALAASIVFAIVVPLRRLLAPHRPMPDKSELVGLTFVLLVISPLGAVLVTCGFIFLFGIGALILMWIGWLVNIDMLAETKAAFFEYAPSFVQGVNSRQVLIAIYAVSYLALLANGIRMLFQLDHPPRS